MKNSILDSLALDFESRFNLVHRYSREKLVQTTQLYPFRKTVSRLVKHSSWVLPAACISFIGLSLVNSPATARPNSPRAITIYGNPTSSISQGVAVPRDTALFFTSGTVPPSTEGSTYEQAKGTLERIQELLAEAGLSMQDVIYINAYLVIDPEELAGDPDAEPPVPADPFDGDDEGYSGWFKAYNEFFPADDLTTKPSRTTLGVESLVIPGWKIEISAVAAYPLSRGEGRSTTFVDTTE